MQNGNFAVFPFWEAGVLWLYVVYIIRWPRQGFLVNANDDKYLSMMVIGNAAVVVFLIQLRL